MSRHISGAGFRVKTIKSMDHSLPERRYVMGLWRCIACGYVYDPAKGDDGGGIPPGTEFEDLPDDWVCPVCGVGKDMFEEA